MPVAPRPNFFLVGSMKSGTTSLHRYLLSHPQIFMTSDPKEPTYFLEREQLLDVLPGVEKRGFWRSETAYLDLFKEADRQLVIGEASANYARLNRVSGVPERVAAFSPDARILFVARDPIERTISHYWYMVQHFEERRDMLTAIRDEADYTDTSHYAMQLKAWLRCFPAERVKLITTEALSARPIHVILDNYATHKHHKVRAWLARHPRWTFHFVPDVLLLAECRRGLLRQANQAPFETRCLPLGRGAAAGHKHLHPDP